MHYLHFNKGNKFSNEKKNLSIYSTVIFCLLLKSFLFKPTADRFKNGIGYICDDFLN